MLWKRDRLSERLQKLRLKFRRNLERFVGFARKDSDDSTLRERVTLDDYLSAYDSSSS